VALNAEEVEIGKRIRLVRKEVGVSQRVAAGQMGVTRDQLNRVERGEVAVRCFAGLRFCRVTNTNPLWLAFGEPEKRFGFFSPEPGHTNDDFCSRFLEVICRHADRYRAVSSDYITRSWPGWEQIAKKHFASASVKHYFIGQMIPPTWNELRAILAFETQSRQAKLDLAQTLGVTLAAVSQWRVGVNAPTADKALRILRWIGDRAAKARRTKSAGSAVTRPAPKTPKKQIHQK
jgi:transcriptional regulator with XRE-family HTH domain